MVADWSRLTAYLARMPGDVQLSWTELASIVGGMPDSATKHYPQWWHGDRPNTRAWRAAGFEAIEIDPSASVRFVRQPRVAIPTDTQLPLQSVNRLSAAAAGKRTMVDIPVDPDRCVIIVPCSARKRAGGVPGLAAPGQSALEAARRAVLAQPESRTDESRLMPAWRRYCGHLYDAAGPTIGELAKQQRLLVVSGGYGVLDGTDLIGNYDRLMQRRDWPKGLLEAELSARTAVLGVDVVAFMGATTDYAKVVRATQWQLPASKHVWLVSTRDVRGVTNVSRRLGQAINCLARGLSTYPPGIMARQLWP